MFDDNVSSTTALSVVQVIGRLGLARDSVYKLINSGQLPAKKIGRRTVIVAADLEKFLKALPQIGSKVA
ncbi:MAG: Helix-turn-helix domain [Alphaproteobacteria bacterium]|jgi:excisionase family DNA binding protein|nr:Helix-turn-helix domain [Alphaproteobacteria bacterium]